jgi:hypothetical protein
MNVIAKNALPGNGRISARFARMSEHALRQTLDAALKLIRGSDLPIWKAQAVHAAIELGRRKSREHHADAFGSIIVQS